MVWLLVKEADWILVYNNKGVWAESALLMDSEQLSGVSQLWVGHKSNQELLLQQSHTHFCLFIVFIVWTYCLETVTD